MTIREKNLKIDHTLIRPVIVGIAGGTGSGKTKLARGIIKKLGYGKVAYLKHDSYYKGWGHLHTEERENINFDHPNALDNNLLIKHLQNLSNNLPIEMPIYDFVTHTRKNETKRVDPKEVIIVEGILVLFDERLRVLIDIKVFVDADPDIRFIRRLQRDFRERKRTYKSVVAQYLQSVRPMHIHIVEPTKKFADIIISGNKSIDNMVDKLFLTMKAELGKRRLN